MRKKQDFYAEWSTNQSNVILRLIYEVTGNSGIYEVTGHNYSSNRIDYFYKNLKKVRSLMLYLVLQHLIYQTIDHQNSLKYCQKVLTICGINS